MKKWTSKLILIIVLSIFCFFVISLIGLLVYLPRTFPKPTTLETCNQLADQEGFSKEDCLNFFTAWNLNNVKNCDRIQRQSGRFSKDNCYLLLADRLLEESLCENIQQISGTQYSRDACYYGIAWKTLDEGLCEKIAGSKNACYERIAVGKGDETFCKKIQNPPDFYPKEVCYSKVAEKRGDPAICEKISEERITLRDICYLGVAVEKYLGVAVEKRDRSLCKNISHKGIKILCLIASVSR